MRHTRVKSLTRAFLAVGGVIAIGVPSSFAAAGVGGAGDVARTPYVDSAAMRGRLAEVGALDVWADKLIESQSSALTTRWWNTDAERPVYVLEGLRQDFSDPILPRGWRFVFRTVDVSRDQLLAAGRRFGIDPFRDLGTPSAGPDAGIVELANGNSVELHTAALNVRDSSVEIDVRGDPAAVERFRRTVAEALQLPIARVVSVVLDARPAQAAPTRLQSGPRDIGGKQITRPGPVFCTSGVGVRLTAQSAWHNGVFYPANTPDNNGTYVLTAGHCIAFVPPADPASRWTHADGGEIGRSNQQLACDPFHISACRTAWGWVDVAPILATSQARPQSSTLWEYAGPTNAVVPLIVPSVVSSQSGGGQVVGLPAGYWAVQHLACLQGASVRRYKVPPETPEGSQTSCGTYTGLFSSGAAKIEFDTNLNGCKGDSGGTVVQPLAPPNQLLVGLFSGTVGPVGSPACTANGEFSRSDAVAWWLQYARGYQMVGAP